jgi:hypothetical protein|tara:strand:+ start:375 stop:494 length:120 start_codon:yes stop_codon:yes gene_type:complete
MQKIICHKGKCTENDDVGRAIEMDCKDDICIEIEKEIIE